MNYPALVSLLICSLAAALLAGCLPYLTLDLRSSQQMKIPRTLLALAVVATVLAVLQLRTETPLALQAARATSLSALLIGGIALKWVLEVIAQRKLRLHETTLLSSLLIAPLTLLVAKTWFPGMSASTDEFLWFFSGFFWCALLCDSQRIFVREAPIIRRREP